jgi:hypothetical protein
MGFLRRIPGRKNGPREDSADSVVVSPGSKAVHAPPGAERETFAREVASILKCKRDEIDFGRDLWQNLAELWLRRAGCS